MLKSVSARASICNAHHAIWFPVKLGWLMIVITTKQVLVNRLPDSKPVIKKKFETNELFITLYNN